MSPYVSLVATIIAFSIYLHVKLVGYLGEPSIAGEAHIMEQTSKDSTLGGVYVFNMYGIEKYVLLQ